MKKTAFACLDLDLTSNWKLICIVMYLNFLTMINRIQLMFRGLLWLHVEPYIYIYIYSGARKQECYMCWTEYYHVLQSETREHIAW